MKKIADLFRDRKDREIALGTSGKRRDKPAYGGRFRDILKFSSLHTSIADASPHVGKWGSVNL